MQSGRRQTCIGDVGFHHDPRMERIRGIWPAVLTHFSAIQMPLDVAQELSHEAGATRTTLRFLVKREIVPQLKAPLESRGFRVEGATGLSGRWSGHVWLYVGRNDSTRRSREQILREQEQLSESVRGRPRASLDQLLEHYRRAGLAMDRLTRSLSQEDHDRLVEIHEAGLPGSFQNLRRDLRLMLSDEEGYRAYATRYRGTGACLAISVFERLELQIRNVDRSLRLAETSLIVKLPYGMEIRGQGAPLLAFGAADHARWKPDLLYVETRSASASPNGVFHQLGFEYCGRLEKHVRTHGPQDVDETGVDDHTLYANMNVWAMNSTQLARLTHAFSSYAGRYPGMLWDPVSGQV